MAIRVENIFAGLSRSSTEEDFQILLQNKVAKIERIVSRSHRSSSGFWYDQSEDEWVMILRGHATLEFAGGELIRMKEGDHVLIPSRVRHRVNETAPETIWLAVRMKTQE
ncbi:MAG: cupin domain-containing protein [Deltaproteobacteria bacterium]|nr:cupin domain-containing protein [Deltaproteobacteria bacterium]